MTTSSSTLAPGSVIGEFTIVRPLNEGGMGAVYVAMQASTGRQRALKVMHREIVADPSQHRRFEQEARIGSQIRSEHVIEVIAAGVDPATHLPYLVMELLEGEDLRHRVDGRGALPQGEVAAIFEQTCHAMAAAHVAGVVHRDLKPENVFLARSLRAGSEAFTVKVLDFGIAKLVAEAGTRLTRGSVGSPLWMAPEQTTQAPVTPAADVWALGLMAYELLTGRNFWRAANHEGGTSAQLLREIVLDPIPRASERAAEQGVAARLPSGFDAWFSRAVAREPSDRFQDAGLTWRAMQRLFGADAFAATAAATAAAPSSGTGARSDPPRAALPPETPIAMAQPAAHSMGPPAGASRGVALGAVVAIAGVGLVAIGVAVGIVVTRTHEAPVAVLVPSAVPNPPPQPAAQPPAEVHEAETASAPPLAIAPSSRPSLAVAPTHAAAAAATTTPSSSVAPRTTTAGGGGFADPTDGDRRGASTWKVQDRQVRLLTRLVANESNVTDATVKKAIEWNAWQYLRCYEAAFKTSKDLPEGTITVAFEIIDQLPRHGTLVSSTFASKLLDDCVVRTLIGQTINAAGPDGKGKVVHAFRFAP
jgi:tRNA A-37 threonylcarbamoyl transferase component Bud32